MYLILLTGKKDQNLKFELHALEHLIQVVLNPVTIKHETLSEEFLGECALLAQTEKIRICDQFKKTTFSDRKQKLLELYYRKQQAMLVQLCDRVYFYFVPEQPDSIYSITNDEGILILYKAIMQVPEDLLDFIEQYFPEYFGTVDRSNQFGTVVVTADRSRVEFPRIRYTATGSVMGCHVERGSQPCRKSPLVDYFPRFGDYAGCAGFQSAR